MIILMHPDATQGEIDDVVARIEELGCRAGVEAGHPPLISVRGDTTQFDEQALQLPGVAKVRRLSPPYKDVRRGFRPTGSTVDVSGVAVGGPQLVLIAGPCAVETKAQMLETARQVADAGAAMLRGGAFKPRTSPYSFQGLQEDALKILSEVRADTGLPVVTEIMSPTQIDLFERYAVDLYQVGSRNMFNYDLLKELGDLGRPVLLKRGFSATVEELLLAAEYLLASGSDQIILCERGIRTFETAYRFTLDLNAVVYLLEHTHLPVIVDPSHGTGYRSMVTRMALAAVAAGAHGLLVEVHSAPGSALSDGNQQLAPEEFHALADSVRGLSHYLGSPGAFTPA